MSAFGQSVASVTQIRTPKAGDVPATNTGASHGSLVDEDNSKHVALVFLGLAALAVATGYLNVRIGKS